MRIYLCYIFVLITGAFFSVSPAYARPANTGVKLRAASAQTAAVKQHNSNQHCDQLDETEVISAAFTQHSAYGPAVLTVYHGLKTILYPVDNNKFSSRRDKALIQPLYKLILFPFHAFW